MIKLLDSVTDPLLEELYHLLMIFHAFKSEEFVYDIVTNNVTVPFFDY